MQVKSSTSAHKSVFELSLEELRFAHQHEDQYQLWRVRGVGKAPRIQRYVNLAEQLRSGTITLCMAV
jgi:hypothetical protein